MAETLKVNAGLHRWHLPRKLRARANEILPKQQFAELINSAGKLELQI